MAVLGVIYQGKSLRGTLTNDYKDSISESYLVQYDAIPSNIYTALQQAQNDSTNPLPTRFASYAKTPALNIFVRSIGFQFTTESRLWVLFTYTYGPPEKGEDQDQQIENPLNRPAVFNIERFDSEYVIHTAKNVEALLHGDGNLEARAAGTEGPIVNAAGKRPDEPVVDTESNAVLIIKKNYPNLSAIEKNNATYQRTTNSDAVGSYAARTLKFLSAESQGSSTEGNFTFFPAVTRVEVKKTTDLIIDNVGYEYFDVMSTNWAKARDKDDQPMSEPINLKLDGSEGGTHATRITYRYLKEIPYTNLLSGQV